MQHSSVPAYGLQGFLKGSDIESAVYQPVRREDFSPSIMPLLRRGYGLLDVPASREKYAAQPYLY